MVSSSKVVAGVTTPVYFILAVTLLFILKGTSVCSMRRGWYMRERMQEEPDPDWDFDGCVELGNCATQEENLCCGPMRICHKLEDTCCWRKGGPCLKDSHCCSKKCSLVQRLCIGEV